MAASKPYTVRFVENDQEVVITGSLRPESAEAMADVRGCLDGAAASVAGILFGLVAGIALALRWSSPTTALRYARELAVGNNAAARVLGRLRDGGGQPGS